MFPKKFRPLVLIASFAAVFAWVAASYLRRYHLPWTTVLGIYSAFVLLISFVVIPAFAKPRIEARVLPLLWLTPYFIYVAGTGDFRWLALAKLLAFSVPPIFLYTAFPVMRLDTFSWQDAAVGACLLSLVLLHGLAGIWNVPVNLDFMSRLYVIGVASWTWSSVRIVPGLGYQFSISPGVVRAAAINFVCFAAIAIPLGLAMRFTAWNPRWHGMTAFALGFLEIFLFVALLEETFFRGFLQNLTRNRMLASCLFGLSHILHAPVPNWRYVILASIAGWFYGAAYRSGGNLMASSLTHALVDTAWRTWFGK